MSTYAIELNNTYANQEFDLVLEDIQDNIHVLLQTTNKVLLMSVYINNEQIGIPFLCCPNQPVIPYPWMVNRLGGNFIFETENENYPNYENFGKTCNLYFLTKDEFNNAE
jgi:hypothetical protein